MNDTKRLDELDAIRRDDPSMFAPVPGREYPTYVLGERVKAAGRTGTVQALSTYAELFQENVRAAALAKRPRATPIDQKAIVVAVLLDGEERPRNFFVNELTKE